MKKYPAIVVLSLLLSWLPLFAQLTTTDDTPATGDDVEKLFDVMRVHEQVRAVMESVAKQQRTMMHDMIIKKYPDSSEEDLRGADSSMSDFMKSFPMDAMLDDMIPVYQKHLSRTDVAAMTAFYSSPSGQKLLREMPAMTAESMQAMAPRLQTMMDDLMKRVERKAQEQHDKKVSRSRNRSCHHAT
jgi:hypothetical protein